MEVEAIKCPACNANVHFKPGKHKTICEYCGTTVVFDNYDRRDTALEIADNISNLIGPLKDRIECQQRLQDAKIKYNEVIQSIKDAQKRRAYDVYWLPGMCILFALLCAMGGVEESPAMLAGVPLCIVAAYISYKFMTSKYESNLRQLKSSAREQRANVDDCQDELDAIDDENDFSIVPERYHEVDALKYIADALYSGKATDLHQAIAQYNEKENSLMGRLASRTKKYVEAQATKMGAKADSDGPDIGITDVAAVGGAMYAGYKAVKDILK